MKLSKFTKKFVTINSVAMLLSAGVPILQPQLTGPSIVHAASTDDSGVSEWNDWGTVKWGIDGNGTLWIKPQKGSTGSIGDVYGKIVGDTIEKSNIPWFAKAADIKSVRLEGTITGFNMAYLFAGLTNCTDIDLTNLKVDSADSLHAMFADDTNLKTITGLDKLNISNVTDTSWMFCGCSSLANLDISKWNTSKVTNMEYMFNDCKSLTTIPISDWDTSSVTSLFDTFNGCSGLTALNVSKWNTSKVTDMGYTFYDCTSLTTIPISNWDTSQVTDMIGMFALSSKLANLDVSKWNTSNVTHMNGMFNGCSSLTNLDVSNWNTGNVTAMSWMFNNCTQLANLDVSKWDTSNVTDMSKMFYDCECLANFDTSKLDVSKWNTSKVTDMSGMFYDCEWLENLDVSKWDTSQVTDMSDMFGGCSVVDLDVSKWDTSQVTNMRKMFIGSAVHDLDLSKWNVSKVTDMVMMFQNSALEKLNLSTWSMSSITNTIGIFEGDKGLSELKLGKDFILKGGEDSLPDPVKTGEYTGRWSKADGSNGMSAKEMLGLTGKEHDASGKSLNKTLDAADRAGTWVWERGYTVTIDPNGGTGAAKMYIGAIGKDQTYGTDSASVYIKDPDYTRKAYEENGAADAKDGSGTKYQYPFTLQISGDKTIYAQWKFNGFRISYHANSGEGTMNDTTIAKGDTVALTSNSFTKAGYSFVDWNTTPDGKGTSYSNTQSVTPDSNLDLYAQWKGVPYTIKFDANTGSGSMDDESLVYGTTKAISKNAFTKKNYIFTGWNTKPDGSGKSYTDRQEVSDLSTNGQTITLYAQWKFNGFKISYHANGGEGTMSDTAIAKGDTATLTSNSFTRTGYNFNGWNAKSDGTGTSYSNAQSVTPDSDLDLYAQWKGIPYTIKFDANTGSGSMDDESLVYGTAKAISKNTFTKKSYAFAGWNTKPDGSGKTYADRQEVSDLSASGQTVTLYAQWRKADWNSSGTDITKTKEEGDSDVTHDAGTYILTIPTKIIKKNMSAGNVNESISYDVNVTGNIPDGSYVHVSATASDKLVGSGGSLNLGVTQGKKIWNEEDAYGAINPDGSLSGSTTSDTVTITGVSKSGTQYTGLVTYSAVMNNSGNDSGSSKTSWGTFSISSKNKKAIKTYENSGQLGFTAGTTLHSDLTGASYQWSINGKDIAGATNADYLVKDADLKTGETNGKFQSNQLECTVTKADGTKETAYVYLAVPLTYSSTTNIDLRRTLTDNGHIAYEGYTTSDGNQTDWYSNCGWRVPTTAVSFKAADKFVPSQMFMFAYGASKLETFDASNIDTSQVTNMQDLFYKCNKIQTLDVSGWDVSKVENFILAFGSMSNLTTLKGIESWNTQSATNMQAMFYLDGKLSADLSGWNVSKVTVSNGFNYGAKNIVAPKWP